MTRGLARLAALLGGTACVVLLTAAAFGVVSAPNRFAALEQVLALSWVGLVVVGALIAARQPGARVAWLLLGAGLAIGLGRLGNLLMLRTFIWETGSTGWGYVGLYLEPLQYTGFSLLAAALLRFPTDRLPRRGGRFLEVVLLATAASYVLVPFRGEFSVPGLDTGVANPIVVSPMLSAFVGHVSWPIGFIGSLAIVATIVQLLIRGGSSTGAERQQMKWLAVSVGVYVAALAVLFAVTFFATGDAADSGRGEAYLRYAFTGVTIVCFNGIAAAIAAAVMRYRLYEVDRLVSRAVSYVTLSAVLGAIYLASVLGLARLLPLGTIGISDDVVVAASTLVVAALFSPARRRVQAAMDQRFNRARYDAARTVEAFSHRLRDEVDLDAVSDQLTASAAATVQPQQISVWLGPNSSGAGRVGGGA